VSYLAYQQISVVDMPLNECDVGQPTGNMEYRYHLPYQICISFAQFLLRFIPVTTSYELITDGGEIRKCLQEFKEEQQKIKIIKSKKKKHNPCTVLERPGGFQEAEAPRFQDNRHMKMVGCQPYTPPAFTPKKYSWYSFVFKAESTPGT